MNTVYMFSGQGSQYYQMGLDLFEKNTAFQAHLKSLDQIVRAEFGLSVLDSIFDPSKKKVDPMDDIELSSASIFMIEIALARLVAENGVRPDCVLGASLGSFAAAAFSGCFAAEEHLISIVRSAQIIKETCPPGAMIAVLGSVDLFQDTQSLSSLADLAAVNFNEHFTISTSVENLHQVVELLVAANITHFKLPVNRAYHSRWIDKAAVPIKSFVQGQIIQPPTLPMICCAAAGPITRFSESEVWNIMRDPILFAETVQKMEQYGPHRYIDIGPSSTLATFLKYILPQGSHSEVVSILGPMLNGVSNFERLIQKG